MHVRAYIYIEMYIHTHIYIYIYVDYIYIDYTRVYIILIIRRAFRDSARAKTRACMMPDPAIWSPNLGAESIYSCRCSLGRRSEWFCDEKVASMHRPQARRLSNVAEARGSVV